MIIFLSYALLRAEAKGFLGWALQAFCTLTQNSRRKKMLGKSCETGG